MAGRARVLCRVAVWGAIAAPRTATRLTSAQVNPGRSNLHALVTLKNLRKFDLIDFGDVCTALLAHGGYDNRRSRRSKTGPIGANKTFMSYSWLTRLRLVRL